MVGQIQRNKMLRELLKVKEGWKTTKPPFHKELVCKLEDSGIEYLVVATAEPYITDSNFLTEKEIAKNRKLGYRYIPHLAKRAHIAKEDVIAWRILKDEYKMLTHKSHKPKKGRWKKNKLTARS